MRPLIDARILTLAAACAVAPSAFAGGFGILTTAGLHGTPVYFYDAGNNMAQVRQTQNIYSLGSGFEVMLGDRDDRIVGTFRGYWLMDSAEKNPADLTSVVSPGNVVANWRDEAAHIGVAEVGVQFGFLGRTDGLQAITTVHIGSGFLTTDHSEFLTGSVGAGASWTFAPTLQAVGTVNYTVRQRKGLRHGGNAFIGVRYLFD